MDILYYSNYCKHSQKILNFIVKGNLTNEINCICIDKRFYDKKTNQTKIVLENGSIIIMPPHITNVPCLLLVNNKYQLILGDDIIKHFEPKIKEKLKKANFGNGEPIGVSLSNYSSNSGGSNIVSEQFTFYDMTPEELSAKGKGGMRQMYNYVPANQDGSIIQTPPDTYRPDKVSSGLTIDQLQQQRNQDIQNIPKPII